MAAQEKLVRCEGNMWVDLQPELLVNIFQRLPLKELLSVIPCVCKSWMRASLDPFCWQALDLRELSTSRAFSNRLAHVLLRRTEGHLREFVFPFMAPHFDWLQVLESSAPVLRELHILYSYVSNEWIINVAPLMTSLTDLDLSSSKLSHVALEAIGKHCRRITHLRRNKEQYSRMYYSYLFNDDNEVFAIAQSYPSLKHLELRNNCFSPQGVRAILDGCPMLEHLDLSACVMEMHELLWRECQTRLRVFLGPGRLVEADEYDDYDDDDDDDDDDDENENVGCGCGGFSKMRKDCVSELDHLGGLCDCPAYDCAIECDYEGESKDDEEEEDGDEDEDEDKDGGGVEDGDADAYQGEGENNCEEDDGIDCENEEDYADDDAGVDVDVNEGEGEDEDSCEDGFEIGNENEHEYVDDDASGDVDVDEGEGEGEDNCQDGFGISDENEEDYVDDDACGDAYIDEGEDICEDGFEMGDEDEEDYVDDDDYDSAGGDADADQGEDEDVCEDEYQIDDVNEEDYVDDDFADQGEDEDVCEDEYEIDDVNEEDYVDDDYADDEDGWG